MKVKVEENYKIAKSKFRSWLENRPGFRAHKLRGVLVGSMFIIGLCEVVCYKLLQSSVKSGDLPDYVPDMTIVVMAIFEAIASPFLSWLGYRRRRIMMIALIPFICISAISWLFLPEVSQSEQSEFCHGADATNIVYSGMGQSTVVRLSVVLCSCVLLLSARVVIWCHGVAYLEEHGPERLTVQMGVLLFVRVISYVFGYHMTGMSVSIVKIVGFVLGLVVQFMQILYFMPTKTLKDDGRQEIPAKERYFLISIARVLSNPLVVSQNICIGLAAAALWGYFYNSIDIIKAKFLIYQKSETMSLVTVIFTHYGILMAVLYIGLKWSHPIQTQFKNLKAMGQALTMMVLMGILFVALTVTVTCDQGRVEGYTGTSYTNPNCSLHCGCTARWKEFSPVCVVDDVTTYLSPCQAGCKGVENIGGLMVYKECACAASGRAVAGACSEHGCGTALALQLIMHVLVLTFGVLALQAQVALILKAADQRDKSVVLGLAGSFVAVFAFVLGHIGYTWMNATTCIWFDSGRCHLNSYLLPRMVSITSAVLTFTAAIICLISFIGMKIKERRAAMTTRM